MYYQKCLEIQYDEINIIKAKCCITKYFKFIASMHVEKWIMYQIDVQTVQHLFMYYIYILHGITLPWPWWGRQRSSFRPCPVSFHSPSTACWCSDCPGRNSPAHDTEQYRPQNIKTVHSTQHSNNTNLMTWIKYKAWDT